MSRLVPAPDALVGKRFDVAVAKMLGISRAKAAELIESGQARVLGRDISKSSTLQSGETVEFDIVEERTEPEPIARDMAVVYEDDDVIVVDKPVGVAAHASVGWTGPTVLGSLLDRGVHITSYGAAGRQGIVSRLDVGTSGLMLVCKSDLAYVEMRRQFAEHEVVKTYHALVQGNLKENKATIEAPIGRAKVSDFRFCVTPAGKEAITHWDVMERFGEATLVSVNLKPVEPIRSACISRPSGIRLRETPCTVPIRSWVRHWDWNGSGCTPSNLNSAIREPMCGPR